ncbi:CGNR zinc finger domain-containing protein [Streptomyces thermolineatus]|uniref:CGNR zinc finger domain-containing protein n=1 Tax=Streptomyces thermolineatus TaxID=44033 RepID=A0ABN3KPI2_9ACTN
MAAAASHGLRFDAGRICLDLMATAGPRAGDTPGELLPDPARPAQWPAGAGLVPRDGPVRIGADRPRRFRSLRELLHRAVHGELAGRTPDGDIARLNETALAAPPAPPAPRAVRGRDGALRRALAAPPTCEQLLGAVARDAVDLLADPAARARLRRCEGEACPLVHPDSSRGGRRRWCSSETCGDRERAARHRRRTAGEHRPVPHPR